MSGKLTDGDIWNWPKTDLHCHADGSIEPETVIELAKKHGIKLPTYELNEFRKLYQITEPNMSIPQILQRFCWGIAVMRTPDGIREVFRKRVHNLERENGLYGEERFAPSYSTKRYQPSWYNPELYEENPYPEMSLNQIVQYALSGLRQGTDETGIPVNLILCIPRESLDVWGPKSVTDITDLALRFQGDGVVGVDLACDEFKYPPDPYVQYFLALKRTNIGACPHAGEMGTNEQRLKNIATCIKNFRPRSKKRIGHAIDLYQAKELMDLARENNIGIERTPLTPVPGCSLADGHLDILLKHKVPVVITSDDPVLMQKSLTDNWLAALNYHDFGEKEFWQMTANAVNTAFYRNESQKKMVQEMFVKRGLSRSLLK